MLVTVIQRAVLITLKYLKMKTTLLLLLLLSFSRNVAGCTKNKVTRNDVTHRGNVAPGANVQRLDKITKKRTMLSLIVTYIFFFKTK
jgi:outer membrane protein assembly factor BamE (lipoprotein component of BamABCDE complex)